MALFFNDTPISAIDFNGTGLGVLYFNDVCVWRRDYTISGDQGMKYSYTIRNDGGGGSSKSGNSVQQFNFAGIKRVRIYVTHHTVSTSGAAIQWANGSFSINGVNRSFTGSNGSSTSYVDIPLDGSNFTGNISWYFTLGANYNYIPTSIYLHAEVNRIEFYGG